MDVLFITYPLNGLLMIAIPVGLAIFLTRRFRLGWGLWWIGAAVFILSQIGHIPFNLLLTGLFSRNILPAPPESWRLIFNAIVLGLSAGLWEELFRYGMYRWWAKDARSWRKGILAGAGHGGMEAILLGGLVLFAYFQFLGLRDLDLSALFPAGQRELVQQQVDAYWSAAWYVTLLGAVERIFTLPLQIAFSVLVLQVFTRKEIRWLWIAVGLHALVDAVAVIAVSEFGFYITEIMIGGMSLIAIWMILRLRQPDPDSQEEGLEVMKDLSPEPITILPVDETLDNLEDTRFQ